MLTAYNYYEPEEESRVQKGMKENPYFEQELRIAEQFSRNHFKHSVRSKCVVCGGQLSAFYEKWGIRYLRCEDCCSIVADVEENDIDAYTQLDELKAIRLSNQYQEDGIINRQMRWEELLEWLKFRTFRYCGKNSDFAVLDYGTRWQGSVHLFQETDFCKSYQLRDSILNDVVKISDADKPVDVILALDYLQQKIRPVPFFREVYSNLKKDGLFVLGVKVGSGFDILALRENNKNIFPYEHILMPSREGISILLAQTGFELLEFTTPGTFDLNYVKANQDGLADDDYFMKTATPSAEANFQRFIQKSGLSSYAQIIARRID